jgi:hypothetical protein
MSMASDLRAGVVNSALYDTDFVEWAEETAELLRAGRFSEVDLKHLAEEVEDLAKSHRAAVASQLRRILLHRIKQRIQPERAGASWRRSIASARASIQDRIEDSPSLKRYLEETLAKAYRRAVKDAIFEMNLAHSRAAEIPSECPWRLEELIEGEPE